MNDTVPDTTQHPLSPETQRHHSRRPSRQVLRTQEEVAYFNSKETKESKSNLPSTPVPAQINVRSSPNPRITTPWHTLSDSEIAHTVPMLSNPGDFSPYHSTLKALSLAVTQLTHAAEEWERNLSALRNKIREARLHANSLEGDELKGAEQVLAVIGNPDEQPGEVDCFFRSASQTYLSSVNLDTITNSRAGT